MARLYIFANHNEMGRWISYFLTQIFDGNLVPQHILTKMIWYSA